jgi:hypothetical protein
MKYLTLIIGVVLSLVFVIGTPVLDIKNINPQPRESVIGIISTEGIFLEELKKEDISFYEGRRQVYFDYDFYFFDEKYYLSVVFDREGEFTIKAKEILFNLAGEVGSIKIEKKINVSYDKYDNLTQMNLDLLEIKPPLIYTFSNHEKVSFFNRGSNELTISFNNVTINIAPFQAKTVNLNLVEPIILLEISSYKQFHLPIIYLDAKTSNFEDISIKQSGLGVRPFEINISAKENETVEEIIYLENNGEFNITQIEISSTIDGIKIDSPPSFINPEMEINLSLELSNISGSGEGMLILSYFENFSEFNISIPIFIERLKVDNEEDKNNSLIEDLFCEDYGGIICDMKCVGEKNFTLDGLCCYGECVPFNVDGDDPNESYSYNWLVGLLIFIIMGIIGFFLYKKYNKAKPVSANEKIEVSKKHYENRLRGAVTRH